MKIFLVYEFDGADTYILKAFSTKEKAQDFIDYVMTLDDIFYFNLCIKEMEVE